MALQKKKKVIAYAVFHCRMCFVFARSKRLLVNTTHSIFSATKGQLRKEAIKIAPLSKLHVNNTCSAVHNKINKISFPRVIFPSKFPVGEKIDLLLYFENMGILFDIFFKNI